MSIRNDLTLVDTASSVSYSNSKVRYEYISIILSYKPFNKIDAYFSICKIIVICVVIVYLLQAFNHNITNLIVTPIEKML